MKGFTMKNNNYWKDAYKNTWIEAANREKKFVEMVKNETGLTAIPYGLGATSTEYISGSAKSNGTEKGDADLWVEGTNVYIEVTGPQTKKVKITEPLWIRPDKIENAINNMSNNHNTFIAHNCPSEDLWRVIHIDKEFIKRYQAEDFPIISTTIRGREEHYVEIKYNDACVRKIEYLIEYLKK